MSMFYCQDCGTSVDSDVVGIENVSCPHGEYQICENHMIDRIDNGSIIEIDGEFFPRETLPSKHPDMQGNGLREAQVNA